MVRMSLLSAVLVAFTVACGGKTETPPPQPAAEVPAKPEEKKPEEPKPEEKKVEAKPEEKKVEEPKPSEPTPAVALNDVGLPTKTEDKATALVTVTPGMVVKNPAVDSPEWLIEQVLVAAMEPDEAKGWALFESLLHVDEKIPNALISRRQLNYPASRRKVKLFLYEDPTKPIYKVSRVVEESPKSVRIYVHNNSENSMPTPCEVRMDDTINKWRIGICSL